MGLIGISRDRQKNGKLQEINTNEIPQSTCVFDGSFSLSHPVLVFKINTIENHLFLYKWIVLHIASMNTGHSIRIVTTEKEKNIHSNIIKPW